MKVLDLIKHAIPSLDKTEMSELKDILDTYLHTDSIILEIMDIYKTRSRIAAVKFYKEHPSHIKEPGLKDAVAYVDHLCRFIVKPVLA
jgi:hypothetical protein